MTMTEQELNNLTNKLIAEDITETDETADADDDTVDMDKELEEDDDVIEEDDDDLEDEDEGESQDITESVPVHREDE